MNFNVLEMVLAIIFICSMITGYRKGFLRILFSVVAWIASIALVLTINPMITKTIEDYTKLDEQICYHVEEYLKENGLDAFGESDGEKRDRNDDGEAWISETGLDIPVSVLDLITQGEIKFAEDLSDDADIVAGIYEMVAKSVTHFIIQGISFGVTWVMVCIIINLVDKSLGLIKYIPLVGAANKWLGVLAGMMQALLGIWIFFYIISICSTSDFGQYFIVQIRRSLILNYIYENNILLEIIVNILN